MSWRRTPFVQSALSSKKSQGKFGLVVNYRELNEATIRDVFPLPLIDSILERQERGLVFSAGNGPIRIRIFFSESESVPPLLSKVLTLVQNFVLQKTPEVRFRYVNSDSVPGYRI